MSKNKSLTAQSRALAERLNAIPAAVVRDVRPALIKGAQEIAATMRALAPEDQGDLKASIAVTGPGETTPAYAEGGGKRTAANNQALVTVGNEKMRHGHLQEFGTVKQEAQPFMRPGARLARPRALRRIADGTLICTKEVEITSIASTTLIGSVYQVNGTIGTYSFPVSFAGNPAVSVQFLGSANTAMRNGFISAYCQKGRPVEVIDSWKNIGVMTVTAALWAIPWYRSGRSRPWAGQGTSTRLKRWPRCAA